MKDKRESERNGKRERRRRVRGREEGRRERQREERWVKGTILDDIKETGQQLNVMGDS